MASPSMANMMQVRLGARVRQRFHRTSRRSRPKKTQPEGYRRRNSAYVQYCWKLTRTETERDGMLNRAIWSGVMRDFCPCQPIIWRCCRRFNWIIPWPFEPPCVYWLLAAPAACWLFSMSILSSHLCPSSLACRRCGCLPTASSDGGWNV